MFRRSIVTEMVLRRYGRVCLSVKTGLGLVGFVWMLNDGWKKFLDQLCYPMQILSICCKKSKTLVRLTSNKRFALTISITRAKPYRTHMGYALEKSSKWMCSIPELWTALWSVRGGMKAYSPNRLGQFNTA